METKNNQETPNPLTLPRALNLKRGRWRVNLAESQISLLLKMPETISNQFTKATMKHIAITGRSFAEMLLPWMSTFLLELCFKSGLIMTLSWSLLNILPSNVSIFY